ncbi:MAG TPA: hypothetical protein VF160_02255 [Candidatus Dormibacteraeota bacterium]
MHEREREMEARERAHGQPMAEQRMAGNGMNEYWTRFEALQAKFIEEPREAVRSAQKLVEEAVDRMMEGLRHTGAGDKADTEELRVAMKRYRDVLQQITGEGSPETASAGYAGTSPRRGEEYSSETPSADYAGTSPRRGEEYSSETPTPSASRRDLPSSGEETRTPTARE